MTETRQGKNMPGGVRSAGAWHRTCSSRRRARSPPGAVEIGRVFGFPITNSMIVMWIVAGVLIAVAQLATRNMHDIPDGLQNFFEWLIESLCRFLEGIIGRASGAAHVLVLRDGVHLHPVSELGRTRARRRFDRMGAPDNARVRRRAAAAARGATPT